MPLHRDRLRGEARLALDPRDGLAERLDPTAPREPFDRYGLVLATPVLDGRGSLRKRGLARAVSAAAEAHPDKRIALWFIDEARVGQKGRTGHRWWPKGQRPPGLGL